MVPYHLHEKYACTFAEVERKLEWPSNFGLARLCSEKDAMVSCVGKDELEDEPLLWRYLNRGLSFFNAGAGMLKTILVV